MKKYTKDDYLLLLQDRKSKTIDQENLRLLKDLIINTDDKRFTQFLDSEDEKLLLDCINLFLERKERLYEFLSKSNEKLDKYLYNIISYFEVNATKYEYFFIKGLINGEEFLLETYKILNIEKNITKINNRNEYINELKILSMMLMNKNTEKNISKKEGKNKRKKKKKNKGKEEVTKIEIDMNKDLKDKEIQTIQNTSEIFVDLNLYDENEQLKKINETKQKEIKKLSKTNEKLIIQNNEKLKNFEIILKNVQEQLNILNKGNEELKKDNEVLKKDNEVLKKEITNLKKDNEVLKKDNEECNKKIIRLRNDLINNIVYSIIDKVLFKISVKEAFDE